MTLQQKEYIARINKVLDYIEDNIGEEMSLKTLAGVANFSQYHFHRIFRVFVGETLNQFIQRVRVEKVANLLIINKEMSITEVALSMGFSSSSVFARTFKETFGKSASEWRNECNSKISQKESKIQQSDSNLGKEDSFSPPYFRNVTKTNLWRSEMTNGNQLKVEVRELEEKNVAYVRYIGPYKGDEKLFEALANKLCIWAGPRGLLKDAPEMMAVYHDDPSITEEEKLRLSMCLTVPEDTKVEGEIGTMKIAGGKYACAYFELGPDDYEDAWTAIFKDWLPNSGYQPGDNPPFELYLNDPKDHPENKCEVEICIPVKPL